MPPPGYDGWRTDAYWSLAPGETVLTNVSTNNRYVYFHAHDSQGRYWGNEITKEVGGQSQGFFRSDMGESIGSFTQRFTD